jgi:hypothetical protein
MLKELAVAATRHDFVVSYYLSIFAPIEPAKPLNNAQIGGSFFCTAQLVSL